MIERLEYKTEIARQKYRHGKPERRRNKKWMGEEGIGQGEEVSELRVL